MLKTIQPLNAEVRYENAQLSEQKWPQVDHDAEIDFIVSVSASCPFNKFVSFLGE